MSQFHLSPCTPSDLPSMVDIYLSAFSASTIYALLFPAPTCSTAAVRTWLHARFQKALITSATSNQDQTQDQTQTQGQGQDHDAAAAAAQKLFKINEAATGRMVAWSRWGYPFAMRTMRRTTTAPEEKATKLWPEGADEEACRLYFGTVDAMREKHVKWDEDYICFLLATDPDFQRRGLGGMLLGHVIALAEADGRRIYLEATKAGHSLYEKLGWRDVDLVTIDLHKLGVDQPGYNWIMMREPSAKV